MSTEVLTTSRSVKNMKQEEIMQNFVTMLYDKKLDTVKVFKKFGKFSNVKKHDKMYVPENRKKLSGCDIDLDAVIRLVINGSILNSLTHDHTNIHSKQIQKKQDTLRILEEQKRLGVGDETTDILIDRINSEIRGMLNIEVAHFDLIFYKSICKRVLEGLSDREKGWPYYNKLQIVYDNYKEKLKPKVAVNGNNRMRQNNNVKQKIDDTNSGVTNKGVYVPPCARVGDTPNYNRRNYSSYDSSRNRRYDDYRRDSRDYRGATSYTQNQTEDMSGDNNGFHSLSQLAKMKELTSEEAFPSLGSSEELGQKIRTVWGTGNTITIIKETVTVNKPQLVQTVQVSTRFEALKVNNRRSDRVETGYNDASDKPEQSEWECYVDCDDNSLDDDMQNVNKTQENTYGFGVELLKTSWSDDE